eukprot:6349976-Prymnesium_polylepis.1
MSRDCHKASQLIDPLFEEASEYEKGSVPVPPCVSSASALFFGRDGPMRDTSRFAKRFSTVAERSRMTKIANANADVTSFKLEHN